jgi:hypothetical protein
VLTFSIAMLKYLFLFIYFHFLQRQLIEMLEMELLDQSVVTMESLEKFSDRITVKPIDEMVGEKEQTQDNDE